MVCGKRILNDIKERHKESIAKLEKIMVSMNDTAMKQSQFRCPYRNKDDRCTAKFGCRNQRKPKVKEMFSCDQKNNDNLNYESYWEMNQDDIQKGRLEKAKEAIL